MKHIVGIIVVVVSFFMGYHFGGRPADVVTVETMRIDTVFYRKPEPVRILPPTFASLKVPCLLFAPRDTVIKTMVADCADSMEITLAVEQREYGDSTYRARISGPRVGDLGPSLEWIEIYERSMIRRQTITKRSRFAVTAGVGGAFTPRGFQPYAGVGVGVIIWQF